MPPSRVEIYLSIYFSNASSPHRNLPPKGVATTELSPGLLVQAFSWDIPDLSHLLSLHYSSTLFIHFTVGLSLPPLASIVLLYTLFIKSRSFILITCPYHLSVLHFTHSTTPHSTPTAASLIPNLPYVSSLLSLSHLQYQRHPASNSFLLL